MTVLIGVDLGKVTTCLAWASIEPDGSLAAVHATSERHYGVPLESFLRLYREIGGGNVAGIVATGAYSSRLGEPALFLSVGNIEHLMTRASRAFLRVDEWGNDDLQRKLNDLGRPTRGSGAPRSTLRLLARYPRYRPRESAPLRRLPVRRVHPYHRQRALSMTPAGPGSPGDCAGSRRGATPVEPTRGAGLMADPRQRGADGRSAKQAVWNRTTPDRH